MRLISILPTSYSYSEHIEIFREACAALALNDPSFIREDNWQPLTFSHPSGMDGAMCFNALCALLRSDWSAKGYKARFQRRVVETRNRTKEYCSYIDRWFATGDRPIVEQSRKDDYWGAKLAEETGDTLIGQNILGRLLMELREKLKDDLDGALKTVPPLGIPNFLLLGNPIKTVTARNSGSGLKSQSTLF